MNEEKAQLVEESVTASEKVQMYLVTVLAQGEEALNHLTKLVQDAPAEVKKSEDLGPRQLAMPINHHRSLRVISVFFTATGQIAQEINRQLRVQEEYERYLLTRWNDVIERKSKRSTKDKFAAKKEENV